MEKSKIKIGIIYGIPFIWNFEDIDFIQKHRFSGKLIGPLPKCLNKKGHFGLPLRLMNEEASLLKEKGLADLVEWPSLLEKPSPEIRLKWHNLEVKSSFEANQSHKSKKLKLIDFHADDIFKGKYKSQKKKFETGKSPIDPETLTFQGVIDEVKQKIIDKGDVAMIEVFYEHPFLIDCPSVHANWTYPCTNKEKLTYAIYKDLWHKGYYINEGLNYATHYLVYNGNPQSYHAAYSVYCIEDDKPIHKNDFVTKVRVNTNVRKTLVWASIDSENNVHYISCQWPGKYFKAFEK